MFVHSVELCLINVEGIKEFEISKINDKDNSLKFGNK